MRLERILNELPNLKLVGNSDREIEVILPLTSRDHFDRSLTWINLKNIFQLKDINEGTIICPNIEDIAFNKNVTYLLSPNPRCDFNRVIQILFPKESKYEIDQSASIDESVIIDSTVRIEKNVVIEKGCEIGSHTKIGHNTVIKEGTIIGCNVIIGSNCTIGGIGFGYEVNENRQYESIQHIGNVVLMDNVEIGNNTCIDRAVLGSTILHDNVKVDNLVHIAHGVVVGRNSLIIANSMIAGSTIIGENVWVSPSVSVLNKLVVEDGSILGMGAVILKNVDKSSVILGNPGRLIKTL
jgi:UDP-3-O-[3-hydroxymyristoyl] glucosamine N-acyltransferase